jgi:hypothetical protein
MTNTQSFAARELDILSKTWGIENNPDDKPVILEFTNEILALCEAFGRSGQSGGSAPYTATILSQAIKNLCLHEPICPITGIDDEWVDVAEYNDGETMYQNSRRGGVFKLDERGAYYIDAIVWKSQLPHYTFTGSVDGIQSRQFLKGFPFTPKTFYIDVISTEISPSVVEHHIKDPRQLDKVWKYYKKPDTI